jgi:hypothetical protein
MKKKNKWQYSNNTNTFREAVNGTDKVNGQHASSFTRSKPNPNETDEQRIERELKDIRTLLAINGIAPIENWLLTPNKFFNGIPKDLVINNKSKEVIDWLELNLNHKLFLREMKKGRI